MLFVCEIKYESESYGDYHRDHRISDRRKLQRLLKQYKGTDSINGTKYACFLNFERNTKTSEANIPRASLKKGKLVEFGFERKGEPRIILPYKK